jgi:hypothetical protein
MIVEKWKLLVVRWNGGVEKASRLAVFVRLGLGRNMVVEQNVQKTKPTPYKD